MIQNNLHGETYVQHAVKEVSRRNGAEKQKGKELITGKPKSATRQSRVTSENDSTAYSKPVASKKNQKQKEQVITPRKEKRKGKAYTASDTRMSS